MRRLLLAAAALAAAFSWPAVAQPADSLFVEGPRRQSGPRFGFTYLNERAVELVNEEFGEYDPNTGTFSERIDPSFPVITQFGWQFERRMFQSEKLTVMTEIVPLIGGLERGLFLPSGTFLVGLRTQGGFEVGLGPNISATGAAYAVAAGMNRAVGDISFPVNVAAVFGDGGPRMSLLVGIAFARR